MHYYGNTPASTLLDEHWAGRSTGYLALIDLDRHQPQETEESLVGRTMIRRPSHEFCREISNEHLIDLFHEKYSTWNPGFSGGPELVSRCNDLCLHAGGEKGWETQRPVWMVGVRERRFARCKPHNLLRIRLGASAVRWGSCPVPCA